MSENRSSALEQTRRLLEAQRQEAETDKDAWRALAIEVRDVPVLLPIGDVLELAVCENITPVPLTRPWVRGLTNVRGQLYTVVDLSVFLGGAETRLSRDARIVMLGDAGLGTCLLVNNVMGLKVFREGDERDAPTTLPGDIRGYFKAGVEDDERAWAVLDVAALRGDERFTRPSRVPGVQAVTAGEGV